MSALANRDFVKMNGLGNEIVIVDLRRAPAPIAAAEARAAARQEPYDQLMALYPARGAHDAVDPHLQQRRLGGGRLRQRHALRRRSGQRRDRPGQADIRNAGRPITCWRDDDGLFTVDMGRPRLRWDEIPLAEEFRRYARDRAGNRSARRADPAFAVGRQHGQSARDLLGRRSVTPTISRKIGPLLEHHPMFPERANITLAAMPSRDHVVIRTWERGAGLTKACGSAACAAAVAAARLRRTDRKVTVTLPGGDLAIEWRAATIMC